MTPVSFRKACEKDADALAHLGAATFLATFANDHPGEALIAHLNNEHGRDVYKAKLADPNVDILIAETPLAAPIGYAMLTPPDHSELQQDGDIELKRFYLLPGWQGGGHGTALMQQVLMIAKERGAKRVLLTVYEKNARAQGFYARSGFTAVGETIFMVDTLPFRDMIYARRMED